MNSLPRILGMALLVVLATLLALLALPLVLRERVPAGSTVSASPSSVSLSRPEAPAVPNEASARAAALRQYTVLALAGLALVLAVMLVFSLSSRAARAIESRAPFAAARSEINALAKLAETSVAQGAELDRERDVRRRAEEDALFRQKLLNQSLEEKIQIGRDLHDGVIQSLYAVGLTLESIRAIVRENPAEADRRLEQIRATLNNSIRDVRAYITGLVPETLQRSGFEHALKTLILELQAGRDVRFDVNIDGPAAARLTPEQGQQTLQIVREAISNALRHGGANMITVRVHPTERDVCVLVQDNGVGFDPAKRRDGGHGLGNMKARATQLGATLAVKSQPGQGAEVVASIPVFQPAGL